ncbi:MAG: hypothetical protein HKM02_11800 [Pseudomonadales bacterium]|nr:hypothetical protein [Pseudomonadales bacterium]
MNRWQSVLRNLSQMIKAGNGVGGISYRGTDKLWEIPSVRAILIEDSVSGVFS